MSLLDLHAGPRADEGGPSDVVWYRVDGSVARLTLNRPAALNAIVTRTGPLLARLVARANADPTVKVIVLGGAGAGFCSGYDLSLYAERKGSNEGFQSTMPWDPLKDFANMHQNTTAFMSLWRSLKPVICQLHGAAVGGGSDIALCCDVILCTDEARIGYPPARLWGVPTTAMWVYRVGAERAKRLLLTGDVVSGKTAAAIGLVSEAFPTQAALEAGVAALAQRMATVPSNQLAMQKLVVNTMFESSGLPAAQTLATLLDGVARHTPEGVAFKQRAEAVGWKTAVRERDYPAGAPMSKL